MFCQTVVCALGPVLLASYDWHQSITLCCRILIILHLSILEEGVEGVPNIGHPVQQYPYVSSASAALPPVKQEAQEAAGDTESQQGELSKLRAELTQARLHLQVLWLTRCAVLCHAVLCCTMLCHAAQLLCAAYVHAVLSRSAHTR